MMVSSILTTIAETRPERVLDIGAGDCEIARFFAERGSTVDVVDPEPGEECHHPSITVFAERIEEHQLEDEAYDVIIMRSVIHFLDPETLSTTVLPAVERALREEGFLYIFTMTPPPDTPRFTHHPDDITQALLSLTLCYSDERVIEGPTGKQHRTWTLVYQRVGENVCTVDFS